MESSKIKRKPLNLNLIPAFQRAHQAPLRDETDTRTHASAALQSSPVADSDIFSLGSECSVQQPRARGPLVFRPAPAQVTPPLPAPEPTRTPELSAVPPAFIEPSSLDRVRIFLKQGRLEEAGEILFSVDSSSASSERSSARISMLHELATKHEELGALQPALSAYAELAALAPANVNSWLDLARVNKELGLVSTVGKKLLANAESAYSMAVCMAPKSEAAWEGLASLLKHKWDLTEDKRWQRDANAFANAQAAAADTGAYPSTLPHDSKSYSALTHAARLSDVALSELLFEKATGVTLDAAMAQTVPEASTACCVEALQDLFYGTFQKGDVKAAEAYLVRAVSYACEDSPYVNQLEVLQAGYIGEFKDGLRHGKGVFTYPEGQQYVGDWERGMRHGQGVMVNKTGTRHVGAYQNDKRHGHGEMINPRTHRYTGNWADGNESGRGEIAFNDGAHYVGEFKGGKMHGQGEYTYSDGARYVGAWQEGSRHGDGKMTMQDGAHYDGAWQKGSQCGHGVATSAEGDVYAGEWKDGKMHGVGEFTYANGNCYSGTWAAGLIHGQGECVKADGEHYVGEFREGKRNGAGECSYADGSHYMGTWKNDRWSGQGEFTCVGRARYIGQFCFGEWSGQGELIQPDGERHTGQWDDSKRHGPGETIYANGARSKGVWRYDVFERGDRFDANGKKKHWWNK